MYELERLPLDTGICGLNRSWHAAGANGPTNLYFSLMLHVQLRLAGCFVHVVTQEHGLVEVALRYGSMTDRAGDRDMVLMHWPLKLGLEMTQATPLHISLAKGRHGHG